MSNFFVPRIDKHKLPKSNASNSKSPPPRRPDNEDLVNINGVLTFSNEAKASPALSKSNMPAIIPSEGTASAVSIAVRPNKPVGKPASQPPSRRRVVRKAKAATPTPPKAAQTKRKVVEAKDEDSNIVIKSKKGNLNVNKYFETVVGSSLGCFYY